MSLVLLPLVGLTALSLADQCFEVKIQMGLSETRCLRLADNTQNEVATCTSRAGAPLRLFKTPADCATALRSRAAQLPQIEISPSTRTPRAIPTH
jgi:hypothetical protein